jgi:hypothetical protein
MRPACFLHAGKQTGRLLYFHGIKPVLSFASAEDAATAAELSMIQNYSKIKPA